MLLVAMVVLALGKGMELWYYLCGFAVNLLIGWAIGNSKGRPGFGMVMAFFLGPIGWLIAAIADDKRPKCRHCHGPLPDRMVNKCLHCGGQIRCERAAEMEAIDPIDEWDAREKSKTILPVPEHLRGRRIDE